MGVRSSISGVNMEKLDLFMSTGTRLSSKYAAFKRAFSQISNLSDEEIDNTFHLAFNALYFPYYVRDSLKKFKQEETPLAFSYLLFATYFHKHPYTKNDFLKIIKDYNLDFEDVTYVCDANRLDESIHQRKFENLVDFAKLNGINLSYLFKASRYGFKVEVNPIESLSELQHIPIDDYLLLQEEKPEKLKDVSKMMFDYNFPLPVAVDVYKKRVSEKGWEEFKRGFKDKDIATDFYKILRKMNVDLQSLPMSDIGKKLTQFKTGKGTPCLGDYFGKAGCKHCKTKNCKKTICSDCAYEKYCFADIKNYDKFGNCNLKEYPRKSATLRRRF